MLVFSGDRKSLTVKAGKFFQKIFGHAFIKIALWDGYKSLCYFEAGTFRIAVY
jgi:hypothetical protein